MTPVLWFIVLAASGFGILTLWVVVKASRSMKGSGSGKKKPKKPGLTIDEVAKFHGAFMLGFFGIWMWPVKWFVEQLFTEWLPLQEEFMNTVLIDDLVFSPEWVFPLWVTGPLICVAFILGFIFVFATDEIFDKVSTLLLAMAVVYPLIWLLGSQIAGYSSPWVETNVAIQFLGEMCKSRFGYIGLHDTLALNVVACFGIRGRKGGLLFVLLLGGCLVQFITITQIIDG